MKPTTIIKLIVITGLCFSSISPTIAAESTAKREVYETNKSAIYGVKGTLKITATVQGQARNQEAQIWSNATHIGEGLLIAAYASLSPDLSGNNPNIHIIKELTEIKLINKEGKEFAAEMILHDEDLGLAYLSLDPKSDNASEWQEQAVDISKDVELTHLDETINISRYSSHLNYESAVTLGIVSAIIKKPRTLYQVLNSSMSAPAFNTKGEFIGITVAHTMSDNGQQPSPVTLPVKYIRNLVKTATLLQKELAE